VNGGCSEWCPWVGLGGVGHLDFATVIKLTDTMSSWTGDG